MALLGTPSTRRRCQFQQRSTCSRRRIRFARRESSTGWGWNPRRCHSRRVRFPAPWQVLRNPRDLAGSPVLFAITAIPIRCCSSPRRSRPTPTRSIESGTVCRYSHSAKALTPSPGPFHLQFSAVCVALGGRRRSEHMSCADGTTTPAVHQFAPARNCWNRVVSRGREGKSVDHTVPSRPGKGLLAFDESAGYLTWQRMERSRRPSPTGRW